MKKHRYSLTDTVREMMQGIPNTPHRPPRAPSGPHPSQELIDCVLEVARISYDAVNSVNWTRTRRNLHEELQWSTEEMVLNRMAFIIDNFTNNTHMSVDDIAIMEQASIAIDLVMAKFDGDIH